MADQGISQPAPTICRFVLYTLSEIDASLIAGRRLDASAAGTPIPANHARPGDTYSALVLRTFGGTAVNLKVFLDGDDTYWACSRTQHAEPGVPGTWAWPRLATGGPIRGGSKDSDATP